MKKKNFSNKYINFLYNGLTRSAPVQLTLFVTSRCNIRCKMCFYWEPVENKASHEISLEEIDKISKSMPDFFWLLISGGEAFVRGDLPEIVETFYKNNNIKHLTIPTNGTYKKKTLEVLQKILTRCPDLFINFHLSLNGIGKDHDDLCQNEGAFEKLLDTYKEVSELKKKYKNLGLGMSMTHSKFNENKLNDVIDYTVDHLPNIDNLNLNLVRGRPKDSSAIDVNLDKYKEAVQKIEQHVMKGKLRSFNHFFGKIAFIKDAIMRRVIANTVKFGYQIPCLAGKISLVVDEKTNVYPCEMLSSVGNLRENNYDFTKILNSEKLKNAVNKIKCSNCYCTHECSYSSNILFNIPLIFTIFSKYILYSLKRLMYSKKFFSSFDDLKYFKSNTGKGFRGQNGNLYEGRTFGKLDGSNKSKDPTVPF